MHSPDVVSRHVRVNLRGADVRVTEHGLNRAQVGTVVQQVRGERMP